MLIIMICADVFNHYDLLITMLVILLPICVDYAFVSVLTMFPCCFDYVSSLCLRCVGSDLVACARRAAQGSMLFGDTQGAM